MTSDQDTKVVAEPQVQPVPEAKESARLVSPRTWGVRGGGGGVFLYWCEDTLGCCRWF